jgi:3-deoxy-D-manno-octulosonic-acid transferase
MANSQSSKRITLFEEFAGNSKVFVAGSTWPKDEEILIEYFKENPYNLKLIIAPHEINPQDIEKLKEKFGSKTFLYTKPEGVDPKDAQVLIIDTIGVLSSAYRYGTISYIGGGFGVGIHNTLEAAVFGIPVIFGPNYQRFQEAVELIDIKAARSVENKDDLAASVAHYFESPEGFQKATNSLREYFARKVGATKRIVENIDINY